MRMSEPRAGLSAKRRGSGVFVLGNAKVGGEVSPRPLDALLGRHAGSLVAAAPEVLLVHHVPIIG